MSASATNPISRALAALREAVQDGERSAEVLQAERLLRSALTAPRPSAEAQGTQRLVIADDEALMRQALVRALSRSYEVEVYEDGQAVLQAMVDNPPAAALLDVNMPGLSGIEVVQQMRQDPALANVPVVLVTARSSERNVASGLGAGADDYLVKPFRPKELRARLSRLLAKSAEQLALSDEHDSLRQRAELTAELLHDMGNVLSSVGVSAATLAGSKGTSHASGVDQASALLDRVLTDASVQEAGAERLPLYLRTLANAMTEEQTRQHRAAEALQQRIHALDRLLQRARTQSEGRVMATGLQGAVNEAVLLCSSVLAASDVDVHIQGHETDVWVEPGSLQQVLVNLIQNAVDALQSASQRRLVFDVERVGDVARLRVSDTGSGMTPEAMQKLFDRGFSTKGDNRGLGLSSCRRLVEGMGGTLQGSSDGPGLGACFELTLPGPE